MAKPDNAAAAVRHHGLVAFAGGRIDLPESGELPERLVVAPWGSHQTPKGRVAIGDRTLRELAANQARAQFDRVALDFNHNTVPGSESYRGEPAKVAAHGRPIIVAGEGIVFEELEWTPEGREHVGSRHYIDLSPTLQLDAQGEAVFIHSAAVCRQGAIPGLTLFGAGGLPAELSIDDILSTTDDMDTKKLLIGILGLPETATDEQIEAGAKTFSQTVTALNATAGKLTAFSAQIEKAEGALKALETLGGKVDALQKGVDDRDREAIIQAATQAGKVIPAAALNGENAVSNQQLKALCAELPVTVPLERRTPALTAFNAGGGGATPSSTELEVFSAMGLTPEQVKAAEEKYKI